MYEHFLKRLLDIVLSVLGIIILAIPMLIVSICIYIDDPGPAFFKQKRVGMKKNGEVTYFNLLKFRTMKMDAPHNMPTHMLEKPDQYITRTGKALRKTSIDELPQLFNIFIGQMAVIGPRPALWNQYDLIEERDKYCANDVKPGLTGWAQINGRDALEISDKARFDGEYVEKLSFGMDVRCFFGTIVNVINRTGVVEGGTGEASKENAEMETANK